MFRRFAREQQRFAAARCARGRFLVQVEIALHFAAFFAKQMRQQETGAESSA